jgi:uncharacterized protein
MNKVAACFLLLSVVTVFLCAQDTITIYYDKDWKEISNKYDASFYRKAFVDSNKIWTVHDYYISGNIQMIGAYESNKLEDKQGHYIYFYENGQKESEGNYLDNKRDGVWSYWYENGQKKSEGMNVGNKAEGLWEYWYESGEKKSEGKFLNDQKDGTWNYWYTNGKLQFVETFKKCVMSYSEGYFENGVMKYKGNFVNGKEQGLWTIWNSDGRISFQGNLNNGLREGVWIRYFGDSEMKIVYNKGVIVGEQPGGIIRRE